MNRLLKSAVLSAAVAATALAPLGHAFAGARHDAAYRPQMVRQTDSGDALIAGLLGVAVGAVVVGALTAQDQPEGENPYRHPRPSIDRELLFGGLFEDPAVVDQGGGDEVAYDDGGDDGYFDEPYDDGEFAYDDGGYDDGGYDEYGDGGYDQVTYLYEPWTRDWYRYCARTYDTFDPNRGTYVDESGTEQFCVADY